MQITANLAQRKPADGHSKPRRRRRHRASKPQLLMRSQLDGRTNAAKLFDKIGADIAADCGGRGQLSAIQLALIEAFCGAYVTLCHLNTQLALGQEIDLSQHAQCVGARVRVASRLNIARVPKELPTLSEYIASVKREQPKVDDADAA